MATAVITPKWLVAAAVAAATLTFVLELVVASPAVADRSAAPSIKVVGAGTIVSSQVIVRSRPSSRARRVAVLEQFRPDFRPQYVLALSQLVHRKTKVPTWYKISVPGRPNGRTGWVAARSVDIWPVTKRLIVYRGARRFEFWDGDRLVRAGKVGVGARGAETPLGLFYVTYKFFPRAPILGAFAFETSAYSKLTDWPGGGIVGVHGTPWPELLGGAVSHGCVRLHNRNVLFLRSRVPIGTPVKIVR